MKSQLGAGSPEKAGGSIPLMLGPLLFCSFAAFLPLGSVTNSSKADKFLPHLGFMSDESQRNIKKCTVFPSTARKPQTMAVFFLSKRRMCLRVGLSVKVAS